MVPGSVAYLFAYREIALETNVYTRCTDLYSGVRSRYAGVTSFYPELRQDANYILSISAHFERPLRESVKQA